MVSIKFGERNRSAICHVPQLTASTPISKFPLASLEHRKWVNYSPVTVRTLSWKSGRLYPVRTGCRGVIHASLAGIQILPMTLRMMSCVVLENYRHRLLLEETQKTPLEGSKVKLQPRRLALT